jgi:hypothetical protein
MILYAAGGCLGLATFLTVCVPSFLSPSSPRWEWPVGDLGMFRTAAEYFIHDRWRLPFLSTPAMGYPEGGSVIWTDAVPLGAFAAKLLFSLTGVAVNHLPWSFFAAYLLQGVTAVRLVRALGLSAPWLIVAVASWPLLSIPFLLRFTHIALAFQGVILWALALHFEQVRAQRIAVGAQTALGLFTLLINPYLLGMVLVILVATWLTLWTRNALGRRDLACGIAMGSAWVLLAGAAGYLSAPTSENLSTGQDAFYSWNLATLLVPPDGIPWAHLFGSVSRDATGGQYEGESYPGIGILIVAALCVLLEPRAVGRALRRHWVLAIALVAAAAFAASDRVYFGSTEIVHIPFPRWAAALSGTFRSQGRFVWPGVYLAMVAPIAILARRRGTLIVALLVTAVTATKAVEVVPVARWARGESGKREAHHIDIPTLTAWMRLHERVWQFPSWSCGGVTQAGEPVDTAKARQTQLQLLSARLSLPNNSISMPRHLKDCQREQEWLRQPTLLPGTLYVLIKTRSEAYARLADLVHGPGCRDVGWAYVCSAQWNIAAPASGHADDLLAPDA